MAIGMTLIEYITGIFCPKNLKVRLWDYSDNWGNVQGIICHHIRNSQQKASAKYHFFAPFRSDHPLTEHLKEIAKTIEERIK